MSVYVELPLREWTSKVVCGVRHAGDDDPAGLQLKLEG